MSGASETGGAVERVQETAARAEPQNTNRQQHQQGNQKQGQRSKKSNRIPRGGSIIDLEPVLNNEISIRLFSGRNVRGTLTGYDQLMNMVVENATVFTPDHVSYSGEAKEEAVAKVVIMGKLIVSVEPMNGYEIAVDQGANLEFVI